MNRLFTASLAILILLTGATSIASVAHAQGGARDSNQSNNQLDANGNILGTPGAASVSANQAALNASNAAAQAAAQNSTTSFGQKASDSFDWIMTQIMSLFAWLVGVAVLTLDYAVYYTVFKMGDYVHNLTAIGVAWSILRDVGNIMLIFGFLAIGISVILNTERLGYGTKMLPMLLVAAVFLNFSLFFSQAIIDVGNLFASQFYTQINGGTPPTAASLSGSSIANAGNTGISAKIMSQLGLQAIYGNAINPVEGQKLLRPGAPWYIGFLGILLFIITAFVLFSLAFILIARFVALIYLIILSPIGFAGLAIPQLAGKAQQWWSTLFQQTITAPVLLLLLYVALTVITDCKFLRGFGASGSGNCSANPNAVTGFLQGGSLAEFGSYILSFLVAMGLLIAVTIAAKGLSAFGAGAAMKGAGALSFGATAWAGRATGGWAAYRGAKYLRGTRFGRLPLLGTGVVKGLEKVSGASFDIRGTSALKNIPGGGVDAGTAQKGGYKEELKKAVESRTKYAADLKGKEFKDLSHEDQFSLATKQKELAELEKQKKDARTVEELRASTAAAKEKEKQIEEFHKDKGTDTGNKLKYAETLSHLILARNTDAAKKIKEEAKKSKDDKDLESLKKMLKKVGGEEPPAAPAAGAAPAGGAPVGGGGAH